MMKKPKKMAVKYGNSSALKNHILTGKRVSQIDALLIFGVQSITKLITLMRRDGFNVVSETVPMIRVLRRVNKYCHVETPKNLPIKEVYVTEYWVRK